MLGPRLTHLRARSAAHPENSYRYPGYTVLQIDSTVYSKIKVKYSAGHRTSTVTQYMADNDQADLRINWSCSNARGHIAYTITAYDDKGESRNIRGNAVTVSAARCQAVHEALLAARRVADLAQQRAQALAQQRAEQRQTQHYDDFGHNFRALGGTPVNLYIGGGNEIYCRAPYGGYLYVPD